MFVDTHAHLDFKEYDHDRQDVIKRAEAEDVGRIINIGCNLERAQMAIAIAEKYPNVFATVGVHPHDVGNYSLASLGAHLMGLAQHDKVVGIGECGLDYYRLKGSKDRQIDYFKEQLRVAHFLELPVILHCRDAYDDMLTILKDDLKFHKIVGVTHCWSGNLEKAEKFLKLGFYISFTGAITFSKKEDVWEVVRKTPLEKILIETDAPYLTPEPNRGKRNEPAYVKYVAEKIAELRGDEVDAIAEATTENAFTLFNLE